MSDDFYPFVDSGDPAPENTHLTNKAPQVSAQLGVAAAPGSTPASDGARELDSEIGTREAENTATEQRQADRPHANGTTHPSDVVAEPMRSARVSVYDDMFSTPRVIVVEQHDVRTYLEDVTNTVYRTMKEQGGHLTLMIIRELVENFIHARFSEPIISILDDGDTIRFSDQGPGIGDKELAFEFGVTSADREQKRYIRGTGSGLPMIQQYVETAGGAISIEDNLGAGTVVTVSVNPTRVAEIEQSVSRGAAVRSGGHETGPQVNAVLQGLNAHAPSPAVQPYMGNGNMETAAQFPPAAAQAYTNMNMTHPAAENAAPGQPFPQGVAGQPYAPQGAETTAMPYQQVSPDGAMGHQTGPYPAEVYPQAPYPGAPALYGTGGYQQYGQNAYQQVGWQQSYQQFGNQFSTIPQQYQQAGQTMPGAAGGYQPEPVAQTPYITARGGQALRFLVEHGNGGPTDLTRAFGSSNGTWSRELATLAKAGFVHKPGQKYVLTDMGRAWMSQHDR